MALPEPLSAFWSAWRGLNATRLPTAWGEIVTDARYPLVWESNQAAVLRNLERVSAEGIRAELAPALREAGAAWEAAEFWDPPAICPALDAMRPGADTFGIDAVMVFDPGAQDSRDLEPDPAFDFREIHHPGESFWDVYRDSRDEFGGKLGAHVIDQLVRRDRELLVPAGLRVFGGCLEGTLAGFVTLISLGGVGYVDNVVTLPQHRRRGVAGAAVSLAVRESEAAGDTVVHLLTDLGSPAQRLYERIGFRLRGRIATVTRRIPADPA